MKYPGQPVPNKPRRMYGRSSVIDRGLKGGML
jgi:hypothetical protein